MPLPEGFDLSNAENVQALQEAGFYSKDQVDQQVRSYNEAVDGKNKDLLGQIVKKNEQLKSLPADYEQIVKLGSDPRFKKIAEQGFDAYENSLGSEMSGRLDAMRTEAMLKEQEFAQGKQKLEQQLEHFTQANNELKIENGLSGLINRNADKLYQTAVPDLVSMAKQELSIDEKGRIVIMGSDGIPRQNADGPMGAEDWFNEKMKEKPHLFKGAHAQGSVTIDGKPIDASSMSSEQKMSRRNRG